MSGARPAFALTLAGIVFVASAPMRSADVTYSKDIAPILQPARFDCADVAAHLRGGSALGEVDEVEDEPSQQA